MAWTVRTVRPGRIRPCSAAMETALRMGIAQSLISNHNTKDMVFTYQFQSLAHYIERLHSRLRIAVIHGGDKNQDGAVIYKTHNPRSTKTYEAVAHDIANALKELGFQHVSVLPDDMALGERLKRENIHLAWLNTGGVQGYNPVCHTPSLLEMLGMPYIGHNPLNSSILDK